MQKDLPGWEDTIVALATPPGIGAIAMIRISGKNALLITDKLFLHKKISSQRSHTLHVGYLQHKDKILDEVVVGIYKAPKSYTGEDLVEISCHGSIYLQQKIIEAIIENGARPAKPGEFTLRAFMHGKLDLAQAEAVADLIASQSNAAHHAALNHLRGGFSLELKEIRDELIKFSALIELELDFSQEDVEFADRSALKLLVNHAYESVTKLIGSFQLGNVIKNGVKVAIVGRPNVGKSTLLNALMQEERAIVSEIAGTTRDTIEETLNIRGIIFRFIDTAGIREHTTDEIESIGIKRSKKAMEAADIILVLAATEKPYPLQNHSEGQTGLPNKISENSIAFSLNDSKEILQTYPHAILVVNKTDLLDKATEEKIQKEFREPLFITAKTGAGIPELCKVLYEKAVSGTILTEGTIVTNARHVAALQEIQKSLGDINAGLEANISGDLLALDIRRCLHYLGEITGEVTTEDKLDYIFSKFCIGK